MVRSTTQEQIQEIYRPFLREISTLFVETLPAFISVTVSTAMNAGWYLLIEYVFGSSGNHFIDAYLLDVVQMDHIAHFSKVPKIDTVAVENLFNLRRAYRDFL